MFGVSHRGRLRQCARACVLVCVAMSVCTAGVKLRDCVVVRNRVAV